MYINKQGIEVYDQKELEGFWGDLWGGVKRTGGYLTGWMTAGMQQDIDQRRAAAEAAAGGKKNGDGTGYKEVSFFDEYGKLILLAGGAVLVAYLIKKRKK